MLGIPIVSLRAVHYVHVVLGNPFSTFSSVTLPLSDGHSVPFISCPFSFYNYLFFKSKMCFF